jgi:transaldolase
VSLEVDPNLAGYAGETNPEVVDLMRTVGRPNLSIEIPATRASPLPSRSSRWIPMAT